MNRAARKSVASGLMLAVALATALAITALVCWLKVVSLYSWRYTSDLFTYDQVLAETLAGHFGLEYTYGNIFGDHAYPFLLLLLPTKILLGDKTVLALLLLAPAAYLLTSIAAYFAIRQSTADVQFSLLCAMLLLFPYDIMRGLYHTRYGAHPLDELAGFIAIGMVLILRRIETATRPGDRLARRSFIFYLAFLGFVSLKEEIAFLGLVFSVVLLLFERSTRNVVILLLAIAALVFEVVFMQGSVTVFNDRSMAGDVVDYLNRLRLGGLSTLAEQLPFEYVAVLGALVAAYALAIGASSRVDRHAMALFAVGAAKIGLGLVVRRDVDLGTWHNYPGVVMLTGALVVQLSTARAPRMRIRLLVWLFLCVSVAVFLTKQVPFSRRQIVSNSRSARLADRYRPELLEIIGKVEPTSVVAITPYTAVEWTLQGHHRYTFYPRGVRWSPRGIADYIVLPSKQVKIRSSYTPRRSKREIVRDHPEFRLIFRNKYFYLLRRVRWTPENRQARTVWIRHFGSTSLGPDQVWAE